MADWNLILEKLGVRDQVELEDAKYFVAFSQLLRTRTVGNAVDSGKLQTEVESLVTQLNQSSLQSQRLQQDIRQRDTTIKSLEKSIEKLNARLHNLNLELKEKDKAIEIVNDEVLMHQIQLNVLGEKVKKVEEENASLVKRWMEKMQKDAEEMNRRNEEGR